MDEHYAETVRVPRAALELILDRYKDGDTTCDRDSTFALAVLWNALGPERFDGSGDAKR